MLNRRILRAKAMQGLYAYFKSQEANYNIARDFIQERFSPDLNSMEQVDRQELNRKKQSALKTFEQNFRHSTFEKLNNSESEEEVVVIEAYRNYNEGNQKDFKHFAKNLLNETENIYERYLWLLNLINEFAAFELKDPKINNPVSGLHKNQLVKMIRDDLRFQNKLQSRDDHEVLYLWYKSILKADEEYQKYLNNENSGFDADKKICIYIYKNLLFKSDLFDAYMDSMDISWSEDKHILKSMIVKTFKNIESENGTIDPILLSNNWDEDKDFFRKLFEITVSHDKEYEKLIAEKSKNWDIERIAIMDKIILKMALCEMIHFPSIPVKVSINEYIELSKNFSTPKSKKFVNGILDVLSEELKEQGIIKKSGRGLIDNK
jgi:transcription antitermination protein NusB